MRQALSCVQAVEFVTVQHDDDLWEELIRQCLDKPEMVCSKDFDSKYVGTW
jgi:hypothetical protein